VPVACGIKTGPGLEIAHFGAEGRSCSLYLMTV
jgi:hypothetical protein